MSPLEGIAIRPFMPEDRCLVTAFFDQMSGETRSHFDRGSCNRNAALSFFEGNSKDVVRFMALCDGRMVGYVFLWEMDTGVPDLGIAVAEDMKGKHLGRLLLEHAHNYAKALGKGGVMLTTDFANMRGQGLYERMGYRRIGLNTNGELLYLLKFQQG